MTQGWWFEGELCGVCTGVHCLEETGVHCLEETGVHCLEETHKRIRFSKQAHHISVLFFHLGVLHCAQLAGMKPLKAQWSASWHEIM